MFLAHEALTELQVQKAQREILECREHWVERVNKEPLEQLEQQVLKELLVLVASEGQMVHLELQVLLDQKETQDPLVRSLTKLYVVSPLTLLYFDILNGSLVYTCSTSAVP